MERAENTPPNTYVKFGNYHLDIVRDMLYWLSREERRQMPVLDPTTGPEGLAIATAAIVSALIDALISGGVLSESEIGGILNKARIGVGARSAMPGGADAVHFLDNLARNFAKK
jgi:hypothetical protein